MKYKNWIFKYAAEEDYLITEGDKVKVDISNAKGFVSSIISFIAHKFPDDTLLTAFTWVLGTTPPMSVVIRELKAMGVTKEQFMEFSDWAKENKPFLEGVGTLRERIPYSLWQAFYTADREVDAVVKGVAPGGTHFFLNIEGFPEEIEEVGISAFDVHFAGEPFKDEPESGGRTTVEKAFINKTKGGDISPSDFSVNKIASWVNCNICNGQEQTPRCMNCDGCGRMPQ
jgi:hypothetical protein